MTNDPETIAKLLETMIETQERSKREAHLADLTARISVLEKTTAKTGKTVSTNWKTD